MYARGAAPSTNLVDLLDLRSNHDHNIAMLHGDLENLLEAGLAPVLTSGEVELGVAFGPETHEGGGTQGKSGNDRAKLVFTIIVILQVRG